MFDDQETGALPPSQPAGGLGGAEAEEDAATVCAAVDVWAAVAKEGFEVIGAGELLAEGLWSESWWVEMGKAAVPPTTGVTTCT